jgi:hypothetical protein
MKKYFLLTLLQLLFYSPFIYSQPAADDYKRADSLTALTTGKVFYGNVRPVWIGENGNFLYENNTPAGNEFIIVNSATCIKKPAFDHKRFAASLETVSGKKVDPAKLAIRKIVFSERPGGFSFILMAKTGCAISGTTGSSDSILLLNLRNGMQLKNNECKN